MLGVVFYGVCQSKDLLNGINFLLYLEDEHYFSRRASLRICTNNIIEKFSTLIYLLLLDLEVQVNSLKVYGHSLLTIRWMTNEIQVQDARLNNLAKILYEKRHYFQLNR